MDARAIVMGLVTAIILGFVVVGLAPPLSLPDDPWLTTTESFALVP